MEGKGNSIARKYRRWVLRSGRHQDEMELVTEKAGYRIMSGTFLESGPVIRIGLVKPFQRRML